MEAVIFVGIQASGKSTFFKDRFSDTHVRINLDMLKTRNRESKLLEACLETGQPFVVDNTNPSRADRVRYIQLARGAGFQVVGYYFQSRVEDCKKRNGQRPLSQKIPLAGILGTAGKLELPQRDEGFDRLYYVRIDGERKFIVEEWQDEVR